MPNDVFLFSGRNLIEPELSSWGGERYGTLPLHHTPTAGNIGWWQCIYSSPNTALHCREMPHPSLCPFPEHRDMWPETGWCRAKRPAPVLFQNNSKGPFQLWSNPWDWWRLQLQPHCKCFFICSVLLSSFPYSVNSWEHSSINLLHTCHHLKVHSCGTQSKTLGEHEYETYPSERMVIWHTDDPLLWLSLRPDIGLWIRSMEIKSYWTSAKMVSYAFLPCGS